MRDILPFAMFVVNYTCLMAVTAKYSKPLQVVEVPEMRARITAIADAEGISQAQVCRDLFAAGIEERERVSAERVSEQ